VRDEGGARGDGAGKVVVGWLELPRLSLFLKSRVVLRKLQSVAFDPFVGSSSHDLASPSDSDQEKCDDPLDIYLHLTIPTAPPTSV
jgi:hypothetical protein